MAKRQSASDTSEWTYVYTPRLMPRVAVVVAVVVVIVHVIFAALLTIENTGPDVGLSDQIGIGLVGVVEACAILLLTRARLRLGPNGIGVRNVLSEQFFRWDAIEGLVYPEGNFCARLLLPSDEHIPVLAVQARDHDRAVAAMERFRDSETDFSGDCR
ncbi:PH domain-containing protein [Gordonia sp. CPCC 205333]|uniref:PH domain-containing protein n=1 Tax=Gordonia sp. CPCC 205333 TaxID=3140790 RepID=UPI003AF409EC